MSYHLHSYGITDIGYVREINEDVWAEHPQRQLFILADGMGGHQAGEVAAREAVEVLRQLILEYFETLDEEPTLEQCRDLIEDFFKQVNLYVHEMGSSDYSLYGMGTTLCCLFFYAQGVIIGNVGDSRIYRLRKGKLEQITEDHSLVQELFDKGELTYREAQEFTHRNILTKAIGTDLVVDPSVEIADIFPEDLYLICSDGLSDMLQHQEIEQIVNGNDRLEKIAHNLIDASLDKGGIDNITVVLVNLKSQ